MAQAGRSSGAEGTDVALPRLVREYVAAVTARPPSVPAALFAELLDRIGPEELVELTADIAIEQLRSRVDGPFAGRIGRHRTVA